MIFCGNKDLDLLNLIRRGCGSVFDKLTKKHYRGQRLYVRPIVFIKESHSKENGKHLIQIKCNLY